MGTAFRSWVRRQLPTLPDAHRGLVPRFVFVGFCSGVLILFILLHEQPFKKILALEALWFQLSSAALLWWESNAPTQALDAVVLELRRAPITELKVLDRLAICFSVLLLIMVYFAGAITLLATHRVLIAEVGWATTLSLLSFCIWGLGRCIDRQLINIRQAILFSKCGEDEILVRRKLRTSGFSFLLISTILQLYPTFVS